MHRLPVVPRVLAVLFAASLACGLPGAPAAPTSGSTTAPGETPAPSGGTPAAVEPTGVPSEDDIFLSTEPDPPPPQGLFDAVQAKINSGEWTLEEALITGLQLMAGEVEMSDALGDVEPASAEGTGVVIEARRYLRFGTDASAKAEIERLLGAIFPDVDKLLPYARPESGGASRSAGLAAVRRADVAVPSLDACADLFQQGFPSGSTETCFLYSEDPIGAYKARVFYPVSWGSANLGYTVAAANAIQDSWFVYSGFGKFEAVDLVFTLLPQAQKPTSVLAEVVSSGGATTCLIIVYPLSMQDSEDVFKQTVAHEMFHCYQQWNFVDKFDSSWAVQDWWGEGTAEYFSNVVYPSVNDEWGRLGYFAANSAEAPLVEMSYEDWIFWQFMANQVTNQGVLSLIASLPAQGGTGEQALALAAYPNIEALFQQFGRDFIDKKIADASHVTVPTGWLAVKPKFRRTIGPGDHTQSPLSTPAFTLTRYGLIFAPERIYSVAAEESGSPGLYGSRLLVTPGWNPLPPTVSSGCGDVKYYALVTSTTPGGAGYTVGMTADVLQKTKCDPCLIGAWEMNKDSFIGYISTPFIKIPDLFDPGPAQGMWRYTFDKTGTLGANFNFAFTYALHQGGAVLPVDTEVLLTVDGPGTALYWIPELGQMGVQAIDSGFHMEQFISINGEDIGGGPLDLFSPFPPAGQTQMSTYSCSANKLFHTYDAATAAGLPALEYDRVPNP